MTRSPTSAFISETPGPIEQLRPMRTPGPMTALAPTTVSGADLGAGADDDAGIEHDPALQPRRRRSRRRVGTGPTVVSPMPSSVPGVRIGRNCSIGPGASLMNALVGDRLVVHCSIRIGQDGFGFVMGPSGHAKVPQMVVSSSRTTWRSAPARPSIEAGPATR